MLLLLTLTSLLILVTTAFLRLLYILPAAHRTVPPRRNGSKESIHLMVVLGSGGHTAEMLLMLSNPHLTRQRYTRRTYVVSEGDDFSSGKAVEFEKDLKARDGSPGSREGTRIGYSIYTVPRARKIHQPLLSTPLSSFRCLAAAISMLRKHPAGKPDLILVNGPATALIVVLAGLVLEYFSFLPGWDKWRRRTRSIYVESWARVRTPSLSCRLIVTLGLCDQVLVQWLQLEAAGWGTYRGVLVP